MTNHPVLVRLVLPALVHLSHRDRVVVHSRDLRVYDESDKDQN
jgi:hypothetical protein